MNPNVKAFLTMIRHCEGTASENGYRYLFGSTYKKEKLFSSFDAHPGVFYDYVDRSGKKLKTSAAGAYQITKTTYNGLCKKLGISGFNPAIQDTFACELIREAGALQDIINGHFEDAIYKVRKIWASLPNSGSNQPEHDMATALAYYTTAGGKIAA